MNVLLLTYRVPSPPTDGGAIAIYNMILGLSQNGCNIDLVTIRTQKDKVSPEKIDVLSGQSEVFVNTAISIPKMVKNVLFTCIPYNIERFYSSAIEQELIKHLNEKEYDFIQLESAFTALYINEIRKHTKAPIYIRTHNIEYIIWKRLAENDKNPFKKLFFKHLSKRLQKFESSYYNKADGIAAITEEDKTRLKEMGITRPITVVPAGIDLSKYNTSVIPEKNTLFSISSLDWMPNIEGLEWFLKNVWTEVVKRDNSIFLHIAGKATPKWLLESNYKNVVIHGFVENASQFKQTYNLMLVPLLSGGGMRVKIIEGFASKKCIISTTIGAEGIEYTNGKNIVIADTPQEWIDAIIHYTQNDGDRIKIEQNARLLAEKKYENASVTRKVIELHYSQISNN